MDMKVIKYRFNRSIKHPIVEQPYVMLRELTGTFEMAKALDGIANVTLHRDYEPEELFEFFAAGGKAGIFMSPTERDLKKFTQLHGKLPSGNITHVCIYDKYADNVTFVKYVKTFHKMFNTPVYAGRVHTVTAVEELAPYVKGLITYKEELVPTAKMKGVPLIYHAAAPAMLAAGFSLMDISYEFGGTEQAAGTVSPENDTLTKFFRGARYYQKDETPVQVYNRIHAELEDLVYRAGFTTYDDFIQFTEFFKDED